MSLSGNQLRQDNEEYKAKYRWIGEDDDKRPKVEPPKDKSGMSGIALEPQRIRVFEISYNNAAAEPAKGQNENGQVSVKKLKPVKVAQLASRSPSSSFEI